MRLIGCLALALCCGVATPARADDPPAEEAPEPGSDPPLEPLPDEEVPEPGSDPPAEPVEVPGPPAPPVAPPRRSRPPPPPPVTFVTSEIDIDAPRPSSSHLMTRIAAGGSARSLFGSYMVGGDVDAGLGLDTRYGSFSFLAAFFTGVTEGGFFTLHGEIGFHLAWPIGIVRLGLSPRVGYLDFDRVTTDRQFGAYSAGLSGIASVDLIKDAGWSFALGARPALHALLPAANDGIGQDAAAVLVGAGVFVEVRFRARD